MNQFKRAQVVILPTEQYTNLCLGHNLSYVESKNSISIDAIWKYIKLQYPYKPQHLYIISDDEIKEGDLHITSDHEGYGDKKYKIIATTDASLNLPQPSQQFIEKYIESYNKGEVITDVLVEYEQTKLYIEPQNYQQYISQPKELQFPITTNVDDIYGLKINPKDNTITIKKLKDSWNKDEIITKMKLALQKGIYLEATVELDFDEDKWIEENL